MLSFITIGRNEGARLNKCFKSIFSFVNNNEINDYEVIYVDSDSNDNSIEIAKSFNYVKIFKISGKINAAVGRNIGFLKSKGEILCFIDGDMELIPEFYPHAFDEKGNLRYLLVSGQFIDSYRNSAGEFLYEKERNSNLHTDKLSAETGNVFFMKRDLWEKIGGMKTKYRRSQDVDFALRLAKGGYLLVRKPQPIVKHNTIPYSDSRRFLYLLKIGAYMYSKSLLYREHVFNKFMYPRLLKHDYPMIFLIISLISSIVFKFHYFWIFYLLSIFYKVYKRMKFRIFPLFIYFLFQDMQSLLGFLFFFPKNIEQSEFTIEVIRN